MQQIENRPSIKDGEGANLDRVQVTPGPYKAEPGPLTTSIRSMSTLFNGEFKALKVPKPGPDKDR